VKSASRQQWFVLALLVVSICINYADRGNLSIAAGQISGELNLDPKQIGYLLSAFFWSYASLQIFSGWLIDRHHVYWIYAGGFALWSAATGLTGLAHSFWMIFAMRLVLGAGESVSYPSYSKIIAKGFPEEQRGLANGLIDAGSKAGPAIGLMIGGMIVSRYGWRTMFVAIGIASLLWLAPWCWMTRRATRLEPVFASVDEGPGWREILSQRSAWGTFLCLFCGNYAWYFLLTWLPWYLEKERHYSTERMALFGSLPFWGVGLASLASGWISDRLVARGGSPTVVRKSFAAGGMLLGMLMLPVSVLHNEKISMGLLITACICFGFYSSHPWLISQRLAGPQAAGRWSGFQNAIGNLAGIVAPVITGWIVKETGKFLFAFVVVAAMLAIGAASYVFIVGPIEPIIWRRKQLHVIS
jgi:ACS family D-galactonate transporter-like MFS transporter